jgi:hypothetical protein
MEEANLRPVDQEAARVLMGEHPLLSHDGYAKKVVETGKADNGEDVDLGNFLAARAVVLEAETLKKKDPKAFMAAMAISSVRGDLEDKTWQN